MSEMFFTKKNLSATASYLITNDKPHFTGLSQSEAENLLIEKAIKCLASHDTLQNFGVDGETAHPLVRGVNILFTTVGNASGDIVVEKCPATVEGENLKVIQATLMCVLGNEKEV